MSSFVSNVGAMSGLEELLSSCLGLNDPGTPAEPEQPQAAAVQQEAPKVKAPKAASKPKKEPKVKAVTEPLVEPETPAPGAADASAEPAAEAQGEPEKEEKKPAEKRVYWGANKLGRLQHKLSGDLSKFFIFNTEHAELGEDEMIKIAAENKVKFKTLAKKVQGRASAVIELVSGRSSRVNPVMQALMRLLAKDQKLTTGDKGNIFVCLSNSYTPDTARAMGNSTLGALRALEIVKPGPAGDWAPNENSTFLALVSDKLALSFVDFEASIAAEDERETAHLQSLRVAAKVTAPGLPDIDKVQMNEELEVQPVDGVLNDLLGEIAHAAGQQQLAELEGALF